MENQQDIEKLFFELASESRMSILRKLNEKSWKMNALARKLDLTTTETFRQLQRLKEASLVEKLPDSKYVITPYGRLELQLSASLEFVFKHKQFFLTHDVGRIPQKFLSRIGELSQTKLTMGMIESTTKSSKLIGEAQQFMWGISPEPLPETFENVSKQVPKGVSYRILSPEPYMKLKNAENRTLHDPPVIMAITDKEATLSFRFLDGRVDYASFSGSDPVFLDWIKDLFSYYWDKAKQTSQ